MLAQQRWLLRVFFIEIQLNDIHCNILSVHLILAPKVFKVTTVEYIVAAYIFPGNILQLHGLFWCFRLQCSDTTKETEHNYVNYWKQMV